MQVHGIVVDPDDLQSEVDETHSQHIEIHTMSSWARIIALRRLSYATVVAWDNVSPAELLIRRAVPTARHHVHSICNVEAVTNCLSHERLTADDDRAVGEETAIVFPPTLVVPRHRGHCLTPSVGVVVSR